MEGKGRLLVVGIGPGKKQYMTEEAVSAIEKADAVVAYTTYAGLIGEAFPQKKVEASGMRREEDRVKRALELAGEGKTVVLACSGDSGIYGLASLALSIAGSNKEIAIRIVAGVTAAVSGAARLGAPLSNDFCVISLSDLMTPWEVIEKRLRGAAEAGFVIVLYNAGSKARPDHLKRALEVIRPFRNSNTVCGVVEKIGRDGENARIMGMSDLVDININMEMTVFIGNEDTKNIDGCMVTMRGYLAERGGV